MKAIIKNIRFLNQFFNKIINIFTNINIVLFKMHQFYLYRKYVLHIMRNPLFPSQTMPLEIGSAIEKLSESTHMLRELKN